MGEAPVGVGPLLDTPVDRASYALGAGDVVTVSLFGDLDRVLTTSVTPEGTILIPAIGVAPVLGMNLDQAEERVRELILRYYRNVSVDLTLSQVRSFKVFVVGHTPRPGVQQATAATRVSEIVPVTSDSGTVHRNIVLRRSNGDTLLVDLARFLQAGDLSHNPPLREGDVLVIPVIDETIEISGRVAYPGTYEYRPDDTLAELLWIANGGGSFPSDAADTIRITRFLGAKERQFRTLSRAEVTGAVGQALRLEPFDGVYVPAVANYKEHHVATVLGEVSRPGTYPIRVDTTTVRDLVEMAGGFTREASLVDAVLRRTPVNTPMDSVRLLQNVPAEFLTRDERRIVQITSRADEGNVVLDFPKLFSEGDGTHNQTLQSGDLLYVPPRRDQIVVLGAVSHPGILAFTPGASIDDYVAQAGGYSRKADRDDVLVLKAKLGNRLSRSDVRILEPGDRIVVPFNEPRTFLERLQTVQGVVTTVSGLVLTIVGLERLLNTVGG